MKTLAYQNHLIRYRNSEVRRRGSGERGWSFTWEKKKRGEQFGRRGPVLCASFSVLMRCVGVVSKVLPQSSALSVNSVTLKGICVCA